MSFLKGSPRRRCNNDLEARGSPSGGELIDEDESDPFDITSTKNASIERLRRWRQVALVLNASRRFRYTLDLKREEERKQRIRTVRAHVQAIRAYEMRNPGVVIHNHGVESCPVTMLHPISK